MLGKLGFVNLPNISPLSSQPPAKNFAPKLNALHHLWQNTLKNLPLNTPNRVKLQGLEQLFENILCETSLLLACQDLVKLARSAETWPELSPWVRAVYQWVATHHPKTQGKQQALREIRRLEGKPETTSEGAQFLFRELTQHPIRPALLVGMGAARLGMGLGRSIGLTWARAKNFSKLGTFLVGGVSGFGGEISAFSAGMRGAQLLQGQSSDESLNSWGQELWQAAALMAPMKLMGHFSRLAVVRNGLGPLGLGALHYTGAMAGTYASSLTSDSNLSFYQLILSASQLSIEGALAGGIMRTALPRFEVFNRILESQAQKLLSQLGSYGLRAGQAKLSKFPLPAAYLRSAWQQAYVGVGPNLSKPNHRGPALVAKDLLSFAKGEGLHSPNRPRKFSKINSQDLWDRALEGKEGAEAAAKELARRALEPTYQTKKQRDTMPLEVKQAIWAIFHLTRAEGVQRPVAEIAQEFVDKIKIEKGFPTDMKPPISTILANLNQPVRAPKLRRGIGLELLVNTDSVSPAEVRTPERPQNAAKPYIIRGNELETLLGSEANLIKFLEGQWQKQFPDLPFPLSGKPNRAVAILAEVLSRGTPNKNISSILFMDPCDPSFESKLVDKSGSGPLPGFVLTFYPHYNMPDNIALTHIRGIDSVKWGKAWAGSRFGDMTQDPIVMHMLLRRWGVIKGRGVPNIYMDQFIDFKKRLLQDKDALGRIFLTLQRLSPKPNLSPGEVTLVYTPTRKGHLSGLGLFGPEELAAYYKASPKKEIISFQKYPLTKVS